MYTIPQSPYEDLKDLETKTPYKTLQDMGQHILLTMVHHFHVKTTLPKKLDKTYEPYEILCEAETVKYSTTSCTAELPQSVLTEFAAATNCRKSRSIHELLK